MRRSMPRSPSCRRKSDERAAKLWDVTGEKHKRGKGSEKGPRARRGPSRNCSRLDAGAARDETLGTRGGGGQLNGERDLTLVAQNAQLHGPVLIVTLRGEFFAQLA